MSRRLLRSQDGLVTGWSRLLGFYRVEDPLTDQINIRPELGYMPLCTIGGKSSATEMQAMTMPKRDECLIWINWYFGNYQYIVVPSTADVLEFLRLYSPIVVASHGDLELRAAEKLDAILASGFEKIHVKITQTNSRASELINYSPWRWRMPHWVLFVLSKLGFVELRSYSTASIRAACREALNGEEA